MRSINLKHILKRRARDSHFLKIGLTSRKLPLFPSRLRRDVPGRGKASTDNAQQDPYDEDGCH